MNKHFSSDLKLKAVKHYNKIKNNKKIFEIFECSHRSLKRWVEKYNKDENINRKERTKGAYKITKNHVQFIKDILKKDNTITETITYFN